MISMGLDIGSTSAKGVIIYGSGSRKAVVPTGWSPREAAGRLINILLDESGYDRNQVDAITATGYGRVSAVQADRTITEISCHARGVAELYSDVRTIIDIGGQDSKVIRLNEAGKVVDFVMNDKCAAGTGRFLEIMANTMGLDVSELGGEEDPGIMVGINSMCTVFAESEIIGLLAKEVPKAGIIAGVHQSVARRVASLVRRMGLGGGVAFTGGVAHNQGVNRALEEELKTTLLVPKECQFTGAYGAALIGRDGC